MATTYEVKGAFGKSIAYSEKRFTVWDEVASNSARSLFVDLEEAACNVAYCLQ